MKVCYYWPFFNIS